MTEQKKLVKGDKKYQAEVDFLEALKAHLETGKPARSYNFSDEERQIIKSTPLLSAKPVIYAANLCEDDFRNNIETNINYKTVCEIADAEGSAVLPICAQMRLKSLIWLRKTKKCFWLIWDLKFPDSTELLRGLFSSRTISFLTAGQPEVRAWTITKGTKAPQAAGKIHTDFEKDLSELKLCLLMT